MTTKQELKARAAEFTLKRIHHTPGKTKPILVTVALDDGDEIEVACRAADLGTFEKFRAVTADGHGVWLVADYSGRTAKRDWLDDVADAWGVKT